ncbi:sugar phosphate nucleotidyltransferase [Simkania negevensis]|uniref:Glucose-1-phosphate adenylyltransferase n=1 Tax=Simkania negevensis (strain ATCC VR-1471 / DSM 27360 / Z) TaxID=331113 RepID=F8L5T1_SIMNZ|nr:sugar phosphate nucleotidyltransferase [Simkania negevensis]CCB88073.1 glucose-1-phosphate adenylyltransferase [Simkania negevensis Z]
MVNTRKKRSDPTARVACIILAGGQGSRLYPLTSKRCKPAVSFGGRYRLIDIPISNSLNSNMNNIFVISQYFSSGINQHIKDTYQLDQFQGGSLTLLNPEERPGEEKIWYDGTADAVRKNLEHLTKLPIDYFLILSGDQLYNMDLEAMVAFAREKDADLTIAALPVSEGDAPRLGLLNIDDDATIIDFHEKPKDPEILDRFQLSEAFIQAQEIKGIKLPCFLASMGIYVFKKDVLIHLLQDNPGEDFGKHLIPTQLKQGRTCAFLHQGYWEDIGTISSFYQANMALTTCSLGLDFYNEVLPIYAHNHYLPGARLAASKIQHSIVCDGSIIEADEIVSSVIGVRSVIESGTVIHESILLGNEYYTAATPDESVKFHVGKNCTIKKAIIDENVIIGNNVTLVNEKNLDTYDGNGVFIRDGVIIVTSGAHIPDNFKL